YTWAFLAPWADAFTRIELAAHIEWVMFLWTLASLPSLVRWMAPGVNARLSWAAIFLFPGILIYDSGLSIAADHVCAFFAVPIVLALRRAFRELDPKECVLLGFGMSGALLTKYQGMMLCAGPGLVVVARALWLGIARARGRIRHLGFVYGPLTLLGVGVVLTAPHWAKNWAWYGDPLFPFLIGKLDPGRYPKEAYELFDNWFAAHTAQWKPKGTLTEKLLELLGASANFSLAPHDWPKFHGSRPVFGSLYTLLIPALFALRARGRTFLVVLFSQLAIAVWFWTLHQDRYLQNFLPWMAAVVAVALLLAFRAHWLARVGVGALVAVQLLYGADVYFIPSHAMLHELPIEDVADLFQKHTKSKTHDRDDLLTGAFFQIGRVLPPDAKVVLHETNPRLGLFRSAINDFAPWQWGLRYVDYESPAALHDTLRAWGVTHIAWQPKKSRAYDSLGSDLRFFQLVTRHLGPPKKLGGWQVAPLPEEPKPTKLNDVVAYLGCNGVYQKGLHELQDLRVIGQKPPAQYRNLPAFEPLEKGKADALLAKADFVITHSGCPDQPSKQALAPFEEVARRGKPETLYIRR
ncbi:MAG: hypothetical protein KC731_16835, partial [Myxococcales bacterium]|nr:hypothetical protein [Myxococcales bacterium]